MDLRTALTIIQAPVRLVGHSDQHVAAAASRHLLRSTAVPLAAVDGGVWTRPIELLHQLSLATWFVHYHPTVYDAYAHWAVLRYLGAFNSAAGSVPILELSQAAQRVTGNQRRVLSEDLGIASAVLLARNWFSSEFPDVALNVVDIDVAVELDLIVKPPGRRADYLLTGLDPDSQRLFACGLLEAKGSSSSQHHRTQVPTGAAQLESTTVDGESLPGLIAALFAGNDLRYEAVKVEPVTSSHPVDLGPVSGPGGTAIYPAYGPTASDELLRADWARLAEIANDPSLLARVSTPRLWERRDEGVNARRGDTEQRSVRGGSFIGTASRIPLPGGELEAFLGVDEEVVRALANGDPREVTDARKRVSARDTTMQEPVSEERAVSIESGTALVLEPVG